MRFEAGINFIPERLRKNAMALGLSEYYSDKMLFQNSDVRYSITESVSEVFRTK
jgi:hypothetical protein